VIMLPGAGDELLVKAVCLGQGGFISPYGRQMTTRRIPEGGEQGNRRSPGAGGSLRSGDIPACPKTGEYGELLCPRPSSPNSQCALGAEFLLDDAR
jgi:hypothetical protein